MGYVARWIHCIQAWLMTTPYPYHWHISPSKSSVMEAEDREKRTDLGAENTVVLRTLNN